jgi:hypothetical protein
LELRKGSGNVPPENFLSYAESHDYLGMTLSLNQTIENGDLNSRQRGQIRMTMLPSARSKRRFIHLCHVPTPEEYVSFLPNSRIRLPSLGDG